MSAPPAVNKPSSRPTMFAAKPAVPAARPTAPWILGRWADLFFLANVTWPLLVLAAIWTLGDHVWKDSPVVGSITFWQVYFLSTPHRWITLALVFLDEDRFAQRPFAFIGVGVFFVLAVVGVLGVLGPEGTFVLAGVDYLWNAWHFAAQHSGVSRIYARAARPEVQSRGWGEKFLLRTFVLFVLLRVGAFTCAPSCLGHASEEPDFITNLSPLLPWIDRASFHAAMQAFSEQGQTWMDFVALGLALWLLLPELVRFRASAVGRVVYLGSVLALYTTLLFAVRLHSVPLILATALAVAIFHATEYLAIVSWAVKRKPAAKQTGVFKTLAPRWGLALGTFMLVLGISGWTLATNVPYYWAALTFAVSFLHYAYDGMIWKARKAAVARAAHA